MGQWIAFAALAALAICPGESFAADKMGNQASWVERYGVVTAGENPLAGRAATVFGKVMSAADKNGSRFPRFSVIKDDSINAFAIEDGTVILTRGALELCYRGVPAETGDAHLAFILGHELAHLANDDFWHRSAYFAVKEFARDSDAANYLIGVLKGTTDLTNTNKAREVARKKELQADSSGIFYMMMAGYDPGTIVGPGGVNFIEDWTYRITGRIAYEDKDHPSSRDRGEFVRSRLASVADDLSFFRFGVRLFQSGRYEEALLLLETFRQKYPGREVFNDIGLCHYMLAVRMLLRSDDPRALRVRLSTVIDSETNASRIRTRGGGAKSSLDEGMFLERIRHAVEYFKMASDKDPYYVPAQVNLASAYILTGEYPNAMAAANKAIKLSPGSMGAMNNKAVALYLFGKDSEFDTGGQAVSLLESVPGNEALYNRAIILAESGKEAAAREAMKAFLEVENEGPYAVLVSGKLGVSPPPSRASGKRPTMETAPPIPLGMISASTREKLRATRRKNFEIGMLRGTIYESERFRVLEINDLVEIVESDIEKPEDPAEFIRKYGPPGRIDETAGGNTFVYSRFAADMTGGKVTRLVFFAR